MIEFFKKIMKNISNIKVIQRKHTDEKDESILSPICISEADVNDNVTFDNSVTLSRLSHYQGCP